MTPKKNKKESGRAEEHLHPVPGHYHGHCGAQLYHAGTVMMAFFSQYWKNEKRDLLTQNAASIAEMSNAFLSKTSEGTPTQLQTTVLKTFIDAFSTSIDADIFITDLEGNILLGNYPNSKLSQPQSVPQQTVSLAAQGMYEGRNNLWRAVPQPLLYHRRAHVRRGKTRICAWGRCSPPPASAR